MFICEGKVSTVISCTRIQFIYKRPRLSVTCNNDSVVEEVFMSFIKVKVTTPLCENTPLVTVLHSNLNILVSKSLHVLSVKLKVTINRIFIILMNYYSGCIKCVELILAILYLYMLGGFTYCILYEQDSFNPNLQSDCSCQRNVVE